MAEALRFQCQPGCTVCCEQKGFVYLSESDITRIAAHLGLYPATFEKQYVYRTKNVARLRVPREANCHFLRDGGCSIHTVKPTQCRAFPFWPELLDSRREWAKAARYCPGMDQGPLVHIESAREQAREMRDAYPKQYSGY